MSEPGATVLIIDDEKTSAQSLASALELDEHIEALVRTPDELEQGELNQAAVVVVDYVLKGSWAGDHAGFPLGRQPRDGLALTGVLRSIADPRVNPELPLKAFVLHSAMLERLSNSSEVLEHRPHVLARLNGLEWVFSKSTESPQRRAAAIASLSRAVTSLRAALRALETAERVTRLWNLLQVDGAPTVWKDVAKTLLQDANPPIHDYIAGTSGVALLRWFLQRVLPHACFLIPPEALAARLSVTPQWLQRQLEPGSTSGLKAALDGVTYRGILHDFDGYRFWTAGVESLLQDIGIEDAFDSKELHQKMEQLAGVAVDGLDIERPTIYLTPFLQYAHAIADVDDCVRVQPDDWPPFADVPYMRKNDVAAASDLIRSIADSPTGD